MCKHKKQTQKRRQRFLLPHSEPSIHSLLPSIRSLPEKENQDFSCSHYKSNPRSPQIEPILSKIDSRFSPCKRCPEALLISPPFYHYELAVLSLRFTEKFEPAKKSVLSLQIGPNFEP
ncbi:hypothetical protein QL285_033219 [Trifolium repens]|nr:hypothetical protein QL285_033219 [Trifolium repens]